MRKKILVLGGTGFIGSHITEGLLQAGHSVTSYSRGRGLSIVNPRYTHTQGDMADHGKLAKALWSCDLVYHCVSSVVPKTSTLDPIADIQSNLIPLVQLLQLMTSGTPKKLVYISSGGTVYGEPRELPVPESHPLNPLCTYGVVKAAAENYIDAMTKNTHIEAAVLRVSNPFGFGQSGNGVQGVITTFANRLLEGEPLRVWGDGSSQRDYVPISDVVRATSVLADKFYAGTFNIGIGSPLSISDLVEIISSTLGRSPVVQYQTSSGYDVKSIYLDVSKAKSTLGFEPSVDLPAAIAKYVREYSSSWQSNQYNV